MFLSVRLSRRSSQIARLAAFAAAILPAIALAPQASAQISTAPQLLPYTSRLLVGGGGATTTAGVASAYTVGAVCERATYPLTNPVTYTYSGHVATDAYGDGCLATEMFLTTPTHALVDPNSGAIYFTDYTTSTVAGVIHRIDPTTGIVTAIAGGASTSASNAACTAGSPADTRTATDVIGDGCLATSVKLSEPTFLAMANGDLYFSDHYAYIVRKISMSNGGVASVGIITGGSGYATAPTVTFSAPATGTTATGTATINSSGAVTGVTITNAGSGYTTAPTVTFSIPGTGIAANTATGFATYTGVISLVVGDANGTSASAKGYTEGCTPANNANPCDLDAPYGIAFTPKGTLLIVENYYLAVLALNPNAAAETVLGTSVPQGVLTRIAGATANGVSTTCVNGTAVTGTSGCKKGAYAPGGAANASMLGSTYVVALDTYNNGYLTDSGYDVVAQVSGGVTVPGLSTAPAAGTINTYTGVISSYSDYSLAGPTYFPRGVASSIKVDGTEGVVADPTDNITISGYYNHNVWRVDGATQTMYNLAGSYASTAPYTAGGNCATTGIAASMSPIDSYGDGCPGPLVDYGQMSFLFSDTNSNIYVADGGDKLYHELATGAQFGNTGASQTDYIDVHFQNGDTPAATAPFTVITLTGGATVFSVGTPVCTTNTDNNSNFSNSTDCIVPVTASPTISGPYTGTLTVISTKSGTVTFPLSGNFVQSPVTRTVVTYTATPATTCGSTTYATTTSFTFTAKLTANGPVPPATTDTIQFYVNGTPVGTPKPVTNIGTTTAPVYGATYTTTFPTPATYAVTATYTPTAGSYYQGSTSAASTVITASPTFSVSQVPNQTAQPISAGGTSLYSFTLNASVYTGTVNFACSGLPAGASCAFSPASIVGSGCTVSSTVAINISTTAPTVSHPAGFGGTRGPWSMFGLFAGLLLATAVGLFRRRLPLRAGQLLMVVALLLGASSMIACSKASGTVLAPGTPSGSYTPTITATGSDGTIQSFTVSLIVK